MVRCCVKQCPNIGVHRFTLDKNRREIWKEAIGEKNLVIKNHRLCTKHFKKSDYDYLPNELGKKVCY